MLRRTQQTFSLATDVVEVLHRTIPHGQRSPFISVVLTGVLAEINQGMLESAKTDEQRARISANLSMLKRAAESLTEALTDADSRKAKLRRLILVKEAEIQ